MPSAAVVIGALRVNILVTSTPSPMPMQQMTPEEVQLLFLYIRKGKLKIVELAKIQKRQLIMSKGDPICRLMNTVRYKTENQKMLKAKAYTHMRQLKMSRLMQFYTVCLLVFEMSL